MMSRDHPFGNNRPLSVDHLEEIESCLCRLKDSIEEPADDEQFATPQQLTTFLQYLDEHFWSTQQSPSRDDSSDDGAKLPVERPALLHVGSGNGILSVAALQFNLCSQAVGLETDQLYVTGSMKLAFQHGVFDRCHFFRSNYFDEDPRLLLDNPHSMADRINESDVVFVYSSSDEVHKLIPLLALLSSKNEGRKFVTLTHHIPSEFAVSPRLIPGTDLCVYDGVIGKKDKATTADFRCPMPEPVDGDEIDKEFARSSIRHAMPRRL